jgi:hypothetical protein
MPSPARVEYEVIASKVFAEAPLGYLVLEIATPQGEQIALRMRRSTFDELAARVAMARDDLERRSQRQ